MKKKKILSSIIGGITFIIIAFTVFILLNNIVAVKQERPASVFGYSYSYVPTQSMEPIIKKGSIVIFKKCDYQELKVEDIIVYKSQSGEMAGQYIIHRIKAITDEGFIMQGDNNLVEDNELVKENMIYGIYVNSFYLSILSEGFNNAMSNKNTIFILIIIVFLVVVITQGVGLFLSIKKEKDKQNLKKDLRSEIMEELRKEMLEEEQIKDVKEKNG